MNKLQTRYYDFWTNWVKADKYLNVFDIDWNKPFWHFLFHNKFHVFMIAMDLILVYLFDPIFLTLITKAILDKDFNLFMILAIAKVFQNFILLPFARSFVYLYDGVQYSLRANIQKYLIEIDPIFFVTKSSGELVAKIERTISAIHNFTSTFFEVLIPFCILSCYSIFLVSTSNLYLGLSTAILFAILCTCNIFFINFNNKVFIPKINEQEEIEKQFLLENIQQNQYIRSTFATPEQLINSLIAIQKVSSNTATKWRTFQYLIIVLEVILITFFLGIVFYQIYFTQTATFMVVSTFATLYAVYMKFTEIGLVADDFSKAVYNLNEFWQFMRTFGKQTFPVLDKKKNLE